MGAGTSLEPDLAVSAAARAVADSAAAVEV
jgi:hypothetical protein